MARSLLEERGVIFNIQHYCFDDGPGIRTTIFLKGCPLHCLWCSNPESQKFEIEEMDSEKVGHVVTVKEVIDTVSRDKVFYNYSEGGITLSGGEPLMQPEFASAIVKEAKNQNIHTAIETSGYQKWEVLWNVIENIDIVLLDIKTMDSEQHKKLIGVPNQLILENAEKMISMNKEVIVRVPVIPGYNDSWVNIKKTATFAKHIGVEKIHLLPYHNLGRTKYKKLGIDYKLQGLEPPSKAEIKKLSNRIQKEVGIDAFVI